MRPDAAALLWDARHASQLVQQFISGKTVTDYVDDALVRSAVERQMAICFGQAVERLTDNRHPVTSLEVDQRNLTVTRVWRLPPPTSELVIIEHGSYERPAR